MLKRERNKIKVDFQHKNMLHSCLRFFGKHIFTIMFVRVGKNSWYFNKTKIESNAYSWTYYFS